MLPALLVLIIAQTLGSHEGWRQPSTTVRSPRGLWWRSQERWRLTRRTIPCRDRRSLHRGRGWRLFSEVARPQRSDRAALLLGTSLRRCWLQRRRGHRCHRLELPPSGGAQEEEEEGSMCSGLGSLVVSASCMSLHNNNTQLQPQQPTSNHQQPPTTNNHHHQQPPTTKHQTQLSTTNRRHSRHSRLQPLQPQPPPPPHTGVCVQALLVCVAFAQTLQVSHGRPRWDLRATEEGATSPLASSLTSSLCNISIFSSHSACFPIRCPCISVRMICGR